MPAIIFNFTGMSIVRGRLTKWAKEKGYLHKTQAECNNL